MSCRKCVALVSACLLLPLWWCGCSEDPSSQPPTTTSIRGDVAGVGFDVPAGWLARQDEAQDAVTLVTDNTRGSLGPLMHIRVMTDPSNRTVQQTIDDLVDSVESVRGFELRRNELTRHKRGFEYGLLEYKQTESGAAIVESFVVIRLDDGKRLTASAKALRRAWAKHESVFAGVIESLELPSAIR